MEDDLVTQTAERMVATGFLLHEGASALEKKMIIASLRRNQGNLCHAARDLGVHRNTLSRKVGNFGLLDVPRKLRADRSLKSGSLKSGASTPPPSSHQQRLDQSRPPSESRAGYPKVA